MIAPGVPCGDLPSAAIRSAASSAYPRTSSTCGSIISCTPMKLGPTTFQCTCLRVRCRLLYVLSCFCSKSATLLPSFSDMPGMVNSVMRDGYPHRRGGNRGLERTQLRYRLARRSPRGMGRPGDLQQSNRPMTMRPQRLQQFLHRRVVDRMTEKPPTDHRRQVIVTDTQRVCIAECALSGLGRRPDADAGQ